MKILITGGAGFIGSQLGIFLMRKKHEVIFLDNLSFGYIENITDQASGLKPQFINLDIRDSKITKIMKGMDVVFHLAGISALPECQNNPNEAYQVNVAGTANILESARRNNIKRIIFSSTSAVYENETSFPSSEEVNFKPSLIYSLSKKHAEEICHSYEKLYGLEIVILRFFNVYGPFMDFRRPNPPVVSYIIKCLMEHKSPILHSRGNQSRDMIYVDDVLRLCEIVMKSAKAKSQTFNVGSGKSYSLREIYDYIAKAFTVKNINPVFKPSYLLWKHYPTLFESSHPFNKKFLQKEVNKYTLADIKKAKKIINWLPQTSLEEGLKKTVLFAIKNR